jgi:hypothetical protein
MVSGRESWVRRRSSSLLYLRKTPCLLDRRSRPGRCGELRTCPINHRFFGWTLEITGAHQITVFGQTMSLKRL